MGYISQHSGEAIDNTIAESASKEYVENLISTLSNTIQNLQNRLDNLFPVGSIYMSLESTNPSNIFGGTWEQIQDRFLLGAGAATAGATGGESAVTLIEKQLPKLQGKFQMPPQGGWVYSTTSASQTGSSGIITNSVNGYNFLSGLKRTGESGKGNVVTISFGGDQAHNNMPPYLCVYIWKRTT